MPQHFDSSFHPRSSRPPRMLRTPQSRRSWVAAVSAATVFAAAALLAAVSAACAADTMAGGAGAAGAVRSFMPDAAASKIVTVMSDATAAPLSVVILTEAVAVKETGPKPTIEHFGEVYAFSPNFIAVHRDEPTRITLWNLQPDDEHDFMLEDRPGHALMHLRLAPLSKTSYVYTFHREGLFDFRCAVHQPEMNGQILVLPPR
jgi:plastocyanin